MDEFFAETTNPLNEITATNLFNKILSAIESIASHADPELSGTLAKVKSSFPKLSPSVRPILYALAIDNFSQVISSSNVEFPLDLPFPDEDFDWDSGVTRVGISSSGEFQALGEYHHPFHKLFNRVIPFHDKPTTQPQSVLDEKGNLRDEYQADLRGFALHHWHLQQNAHSYHKKPPSWHEMLYERETKLTQRALAEKVIEELIHKFLVLLLSVIRTLIIVLIIVYKRLTQSLTHPSIINLRRRDEVFRQRKKFSPSWQEALAI